MGNEEYRVDLSELFTGCAILAQACMAAGLKVASALDVLNQAHGRSWDLPRRDHRADAAYLIVYVIEPKVLHAGI